jgi:hypothetical protein
MAGWWNWLAGMWYTAQVAADSSLSGTQTDRSDQCYLFQDAAEETTRQAEVLMQRLADQLEMLYRCREESEAEFDIDGKTNQMLMQVQRQGQLVIEQHKSMAIVLRASRPQQQAASE